MWYVYCLSVFSFVLDTICFVRCAVLTTWISTVGIIKFTLTLTFVLFPGWPFGSLVCKMSGMVQGISVSASVFTLVAIAVDRSVVQTHFILSTYTVSLLWWAKWRCASVRKETNSPRGDMLSVTMTFFLITYRVWICSNSQCFLNVEVPLLWAWLWYPCGVRGCTKSECYLFWACQKED